MLQRGLQMSEKTAKQKRKKEEGYCEKCHSRICPCVIEQIRNMESAMVVAKQAIESLDAMLHKKILEYEEAVKSRDEYKMRWEGKQQGDLNQKMRDIDAQTSRFTLRNKIAVH